MAGLKAAPVGAVVAGGVAAALHVGKLPPALPALEHDLGLGLVAGGFLLSLVQAAGMALGLMAGLAADTLGLRRCMLIGLALLTLAGAAGGLAVPAVDPVAWLLGCRVLEGLGFLLAVMPAPGLIRRLAPAGMEKRALGLWGAYMPGGVALGLLLGPWLIGAAGWRPWWWGVAGLSALAAALIAATVAPDPRAQARAAAPGAWRARLGATLGAAGPWSAALAFGLYSAQWMSVIGFLPTIYVQAGLAAGATAALTALAAALNMVGNVVGGRMLQAGWPPLRLLCLGFGCMVLGSAAAFAQGQGGGLPPGLRYLAVCLFSMGGGAVPATLFMLSVRVAPGPQTVSTTVGLMQQISSLGQFAAPPVVGWIAHRTGGWQWTWLFTLACSALGVLAALRLCRADREAA
ncbi:CynX/NimT family MFS transporter [Xenophilus sp. Marseille-Q4582]|uniref:MFS transporter n=1 Tax=Xenophilus sp. Marseille-Q4582 TaxID=2866600 RepID=UPI001CE3E30D|nr:MFS transporter [Xenophilus sp. Marseille-Q4582]